MTEKKSSKSGVGRTRNWSFVVYPDSVPSDWRDIIDNEHIEWIESPLHDKDLNADGEFKKPHWHVLLMYDGVKAYEQVLELTIRLNSTIPQKVSSAKGLCRYMAHLDNPEKYQYDRSLIIGHGGADVLDLLKPTSSARYILIREMSEYIRKSNITEYEELWFYAMENRFDDWFPLLCDSATYCLNALIKSRRHRSFIKSSSFPVDLETGELKGGTFFE